jgi:hypothetical protein
MCSYNVCIPFVSLGTLIEALEESQRLKAFFLQRANKVTALKLTQDRRHEAYVTCLTDATFIM